MRGSTCSREARLQASSKVSLCLVKYLLMSSSLLNFCCMSDLSSYYRWRLVMRKALSPSEKASIAPSTVGPESEVDEDEKLLHEMEDLTNAMEQKKKRAKKLVAKRDAKVLNYLIPTFCSLLVS